LKKQNDDQIFNKQQTAKILESSYKKVLKAYKQINDNKNNQKQQQQQQNNNQSLSQFIDNMQHKINDLVNKYVIQYKKRSKPN